MLAIGLSFWVQYARTVRGVTLVERNKEYVEAARLIGIGPFKIMFQHILPNVLGPVLVIATINLALAIITEATLSFLGVGLPPTEPSLGTMIQVGNKYLFSGSWWMVAKAFLTLPSTVRIAEVPSTLSEVLLLDYMLQRSTDPTERIVLLQHAIDNITSTFYTQVMFADFELRAHRLAEEDKPITAEILTEMYSTLLKDYYGDAVDLNDLTGVTWARIPHFFNSPYYVYQYATCFASAARLSKEIMSGSEADRARARESYLDLLRSGGSDHPMALLQEGRRRSQSARHGQGDHRAARHPGDSARAGAESREPELIRCRFMTM